MKTMLKLLLAISLLVSLAGCSGNSRKEDVPEEYQMKMLGGGVTFALPEKLRDIKGCFFPYFGTEAISGSGVYYTILYYLAMPEDTFSELNNKEELTEEEDNFISDRFIPLLEVYAIDGNRGLKELGEFLGNYEIPTEGIEQLQKVGEYTFFRFTLPDKDYYYANTVFDEGYKEEFDNVIVPALKDTSWIWLSEPKTGTRAQEGTKVEFEAYDLDGNTVRSEDIFSQNTITMINIWGTYCGPCINEMPDLEVLNKRLGEKNCAIIGVVCDIAGPNDKDHIELAREIIKETGVTYMNILPWDKLDIQLPSQYIPTTYFVDSDGHVVGEMLVGARGADDYESVINNLLAQLGK